jgi:hypothetical protein
MTEGPFGRRPASPQTGEGLSLPPEGGEESPEETTRAPVKPGPPRPPGGIASPATWVAGVVLAIVLVYVTLNSLTTEGPGSRGVGVGRPVPPFAAPLALADLKCDGDKECDANVLVKESDGVPKACDARGPNILNSCQMAERGPLVLAFMVAPSKQCIDQIDLLERIRPRFPKVQFAAVAIRGDHGDLNTIIRERGWELPVAYDHDGAIANAFAVAVCPTITFADKGGEVRSTTLGTAGEAEIVRKIRELR